MANKLTRREALKLFGASAAGAALSPALSADGQRVSRAAQMDGAVLDVAIIGGGMSGVYAGWRLLGEEAGDSEVLRALMRARGSGALEVALPFLDHE
jgi:hypothetical protein